MSHAAAAPVAPTNSAPAATAATAAPVIDPVTVTAEKLFIALAGGGVVISNNAATLPVDAKNLAKLSFELSKAFHEVELAGRAKVVQTVANFDANMCDFDAWSSKPAA